ncbi:unnamed protein product [Caenorhabditis bovis]|uniref:Uncharacterized protein n=1 Tax=Caenorhabditis bovis TaxID=2654633 RepID=A0A8S1FFQ9_9PELO|nr:unnamed protein product [Caenorhabditis bovis]
MDQKDQVITVVTVIGLRSIGSIFAISGYCSYSTPGLGNFHQTWSLRVVPQQVFRGDGTDGPMWSVEELLKH